MRKTAKIVIDSSDDELPDIRALVRGNKEADRRKVPVHHTNEKNSTPRAAEENAARGSNTVRRRKLGQVSGQSLLRPWKQDDPSRPRDASEPRKSGAAQRSEQPTLRLRERKPRAAAEVIPAEEEDDEEFISAKEEITIVEEAGSEYNASVFSDGQTSDFEDDSEFEQDSGLDPSPKKRSLKPRSVPKFKPPTGLLRRPVKSLVQRRDEKPTDRPARQGGDIAGKTSAKTRTVGNNEKSTEKGPRASKTRNRVNPDDDLTKNFSRLGIAESAPSDTEEGGRGTARPSTPSLTPPKPRPTSLLSPKKMAPIPSTPHRPSTDMFWSQEFIDDWNEQHSPKKQLFPDASKSAAKADGAKKSKGKDKGKGKGKGKGKTACEREVKRAFESAKREIAEQFLRDLDAAITGGKIAELAASTGGVQLTWTNKLNTTAGRANWRRETVRTKAADGEPAVPAKHRHFASIELAEKVIDNEDRLLNVMAHEFCHLANFMVNGLTTNPHGREFKAWAAKCSAAFGHRGIRVTTKHSYDIDFKYVWECSSCSTEFKRHSKSINPERHRCGKCKSLLVQTKPAPRATAKTSQYQDFMKQQMKILKEENPGSPQKHIMKLVAEKWAQKLKAHESAVSENSTPLGHVQGLDDLAINEEDGLTR